MRSPLLPSFQPAKVPRLSFAGMTHDIGQEDGFVNGQGGNRQLSYFVCLPNRATVNGNQGQAGGLQIAGTNTLATSFIIPYPICLPFQIGGRHQHRHFVARSSTATASGVPGYLHRFSNKTITYYCPPPLRASPSLPPAFVFQFATSFRFPPI